MPTFPDNSRMPSAAFAAVHQALGRVPAEFATAGELAKLMAALSPHTPVSVAETVHIDPDLDLDVTPNCTAAAATVITLLEPRAGSDDLADGLAEASADKHPRVLPGVELGAFIVTEGAQVPERTTAFPPYEAAVEALQVGDVAKALQAECELLTWMAGTLADPVPDDSDAAPAWITDVDLREELAVEGERLRQCAARLTALRAKVPAAGHDGS
jgi:hypothetical protein